MEDQPNDDLELNVREKALYELTKLKSEVKSIKLGMLLDKVRLLLDCVKTLVIIGTASYSLAKFAGLISAAQLGD